MVPRFNRRRARQWVFAVTVSILVAIVAQVMFVILSFEVGDNRNAWGEWTLLVSAALGFLVLIREFRAYSLLIFPIYLWGMYYILATAGFLFAIEFYGDRL